MTPFWICALPFFLLLEPNLSHAAWDYFFERIDNKRKSSTGHVIFDVEVERINRTDFALTGNVTFRSPFKRIVNAYFHSLSFFVNPSEENQNEKVPIHFPRITYCEFSSIGHRKYRVKSYKPPLSNYFHSDDPSEDLCHGFQADNDLNFYVYKFVIDKSAEPPYIADGLFKVETLFELDDSTTAGITLVVRLENERDYRRRRI
ncbi:uncharacterized protein LOC116338868 [Contarinia nasturtii]|uniref:uncharacterized protein LOC116338868 n=1 Tax=Contarinia nasturtii TaxID=265458 RepID=UPI0012D464DE|nr:uncharacterized protein LOC116338868 [Contarinia nasturtii]